MAMKNWPLGGVPFGWKKSVDSFCRTEARDDGLGR